MFSKFTHMSTPSTRAEFEERLNVLREQLRLGKMHFARGLRVEDSLRRVRMLPNGRIDLLSVDESARLQANTIYQYEIHGFGEELHAAMDAAPNVGTSHR